MQVPKALVFPLLRVTMNKKIAEIIKSIIDEFVLREDMMKELLDDKDKVIKDLKQIIKKLENKEDYLPKL